ncbi:MAG: porin [Pseudomonadota bacterium]
MKKVLLASTALVASAGIAAADVSLSGSAELGIFDNDVETQLHTDIDVTFTMSGETDSGLTFGASIDIDEAGNGEPFEDPDTQGGETIFISGNFGTLTMGDTDGALDRALSEAIFGGSIQDENEHSGYNGNNGLDGEFYDGQIARYDYSFGDVALAVSAELDDTGAGDPVIGLGVSYDVDLGGVDLGLGLGYQTVSSAGAANDTDADLIGFSVDAGFAGGFSAAASFIVGDVTVAGAAQPDPEHIGLAVGYSMDALTVGLNWGEYSDWILGEGDQSGVGLVVGYDLGGGAEAQFGIANNDPNDGVSPDTTVWSLGVAMSF